MKNHIAGMQVDKTTGELKPSNWMQKLTSNNPNDIAPAVYEGVKQMGPAVFHQTQQFATPQYIAQQKARGTAAQATTAAQTTAAQTGATQATTAQQLAGYQQELQTLRATPSDQRTPQQVQRMEDLQNLVLGSNPQAAWTPIAGQKPYQHNGTGPYFMAFRSNKGLGVMERPMPPDFKPTLTSTQLPVQGWAYDEHGKIMSTEFSKETGEELPNARNYTRAIPPAFLGRLTKSNYVTSDNAGNATYHSVTSMAGPPGQVGQTAPGTSGLNEPATVAPSAPGAQTQPSTIPQPTARQTKAGVNPPGTPTPNSPAHGAAVAPPHDTPAAQNFRNPQSPASYTPPASVAEANTLDPRDPDWQPDPNDLRQVYAKLKYDGGEQSFKYPANPKWLPAATDSWMMAHGMKPGDVDTTAERTAFHAMRDAAPSINYTVGLMEKAMGITSNMTPEQKRAIINQNNGPEAAFSQWLKMGAYKNGVSPGDLNSQINQNAALDALVGTAPWIKNGRNKQVYADIQQHLPNVNKDSIGQMYDKLTGMQDIFNRNIGAYNTRHHYSSDYAGSPSATPQPTQQAAPPPPGPQTHIFNADAWAADPKNKGQDVNAAIAQAKQAGYKILQKAH
jgi:hypothetical protein